MNLCVMRSAKGLSILVVGVVALGLALPTDFGMTRFVEIQLMPA
jgi:hypothetical protein